MMSYLTTGSEDAHIESIDGVLILNLPGAGSVHVDPCDDSTDVGDRQTSVEVHEYICMVTIRVALVSMVQ